MAEPDLLTSSGEDEMWVSPPRHETHFT